MSDGPIREPAEVSVGLLVDSGGRLLLQHRDDKPGLSGAGLWGFFGGHVEPGERPSRALVRELSEELGWRPRHFEHYLSVEVAQAEADRGDGWDVISHVFAAHLDATPEALTLGEGQGMGLFAPDALPDAIIPGVVPVIEEFARSPVYRRLMREYDFISVTALLVDAEGRFLLQLRDDKPGIVNPGLWGSFGGRVEPHETDEAETPDEALLRELHEELAWQPATFELYAAGAYRSLPDGDDRGQLVYVYAAPVDVSLDAMTLGEGEAMASFPPDALPEPIVPALRVLIGRFVNDPLYGEMIRRAHP